MEVYVDNRDMFNIPCDLFGLWHFSDEKPLKGITGLLDWRLDAKISGLVISGRITGMWEEKVILESPEGFPGIGFVIFGLGPMGEFGQERMREAGRIMVRMAMNLNMDTLCIALPGNGIPDLDTVIVAENVLYGLVNEVGHKAFTPRFMCGQDDIDEAILGFQKTKISLKSQITTEIIQVKP